MLIRVYGSPDCAMCVKAKQELVRHNIPYEYIDCSEPGGLAELVANVLIRTLELPIITDEQHNILSLAEAMTRSKDTNPSP